MGLGVVVHSGVGGALVGSRRFLPGSNGGEGGGEVGERLVERYSRVSYWKGDEVDMFPASSKGRE